MQPLKHADVFYRFAVNFVSSRIHICLQLPRHASRKSQYFQVVRIAQGNLLLRSENSLQRHQLPTPDFQRLQLHKNHQSNGRDKNVFRILSGATPLTTQWKLQNPELDQFIQFHASYENLQSLTYFSLEGFNSQRNCLLGSLQQLGCVIALIEIKQVFLKRNLSIWSFCEHFVEVQQYTILKCCFTTACLMET